MTGMAKMIKMKVQVKTTRSVVSRKNIEPRNASLYPKFWPACGTQLCPLNGNKKQQPG